MSVPSIQSGYSFSYFTPSFDSEEKEIMNRLMAYGVTPTGNKATDRAMLRRIEEQKAKEDNCVSNKYLTVSTQEQERIQNKKKAKRKEINKDDDINKMNQQRVGADYLGQQVFLAIQLKDKEKKEELKKGK